MGWWGTNIQDITLGTDFIMGPGGNPDSGMWVVQCWINGKYLELVRDLAANTNHILNFSIDDEKGKAILRGIGDSRSGVAGLRGIRYTGGIWSEGGQSNQKQLMNMADVTFRVPDTEAYRPSVSYTLAPVNGLNGNYIKGKSKLQLTITANAKEGATIKDVKVETQAGEVFHGSTSGTSTITTGLLSTAGTFWVKVTVTDGRGLTTSLQKTITVIDYSEPKITAFKVERCNSGGTVQANGTYGKVTYNYSCTNISGNTVTVKFQYSTNDGTSWTDIKTLTTLSGNSNFTTGNIIPTTSRVIFRLIITDKYSTSDTRYDVGPAAAWMGHSQNSVVFGREYTGNDARFFTTSWGAVLEKGHCTRALGAANSNEGWVKVIQIEAVQAWFYGPITFDISLLSKGSTRLSIGFSGRATAAETQLSTVTVSNKIVPIKVNNDGSGIFSVWVKKPSGAYSITIGDLLLHDRGNGWNYEVTYPSSFQTTEPSGMWPILDILDAIYPVGMAVQFEEGKNPNSAIGGTWTRYYINLETAASPGQGLVTAEAQYTNNNPVVIYTLGNSRNDSWNILGKTDPGAAKWTKRFIMWVRTA